MTSFPEKTGGLVPAALKQTEISAFKRLWGVLGFNETHLQPLPYNASRETVVQTAKERLLTRLVAEQIWKIQGRIFSWAAAIAIAGGVVAGDSWLLSSHPMDISPESFIPVSKFELVITIASKGVLAIGSGAIVYYLIAPKLIRSIELDELEKRAEGITERVFRREIPEGTPPDLDDGWRHGWLAADSRPRSAELSPYDLKHLEIRKRLKWWGTAAVTVSIGSLTFPAWAVLALPALAFLPRGVGKNLSKLDYLLFETPIGKASLIAAAIIGGSISNAMILLIIGLIRLWRDNQDTSPRLLRALELKGAAAVEASLYTQAGGLPFADLVESARKEQIENAVRDRSPLFVLGTSTGLLAARGDLFAPSEGLPFALSLTDLQRHLLVLGGTGSGKTAGILRPVIGQALNLSGVGLVILDGKGALPAEYANTKGVQLITPKNAEISLVDGVSPSTLIDTLVDVLSPSTGSSEPFWTISAADLLRKAATLAHAASGEYWTLANIGRAAFQTGFRKEIINAIPRGKASLEVVQAAEFFAQEWDKIPADDKTKAGIEATARSWMNAIAAHPDLQKWMNTAPGSDTVDITTALQGARLAVNLPDYLYGSAGAAVVALLKARLYGKLKARAEGWQMNDVPVLIVMDEAQEIATREDAVMLAIGRSLGLGVVAATQTVEGVHARLHGFASKWLGIFSHAIALRGRSPDTDHWMSLRTGAIWQARSQMGNGLTLDQGIIHDSVTDLQAAALHQPEMNIQDMVWWLRTGAHSQRHTDEDAQFEKPIRQIEKDIMTGTSSSIGVMPIINQGELPELLAKPLTALASVTRAGVERRDVITLKPVFPE